ncbi:MAG: DoxX family protein [Bacteroidales bacterium]|jgi:hypothetical protein|nr:DoxX family protein [Bacteroidales bacterium]HOL98171.1 DoxX family protein [Bacteroidales bacterium]HOM36529.1 DoxX family protein [Bacteroidales bacterium]HPD23931.1 DoxX family protein [Bacteroidales bacterium]HRS99911.1 DoxX family protein [Bacteroidales bacterium]
MKDKIIFWISTAFISLWMLMSAVGYFLIPDMKTNFQHLGFPDYFRIELGIAKILGALAILLPLVPSKLKEFSYFGFILTFFSAIVAHLSVGDPFYVSLFPLFALIVILISFTYYHKLNNKN